MSSRDETSEIIERIYDVAIDPLRYEEMLDVWERRLSAMRLRADAQAVREPLAGDGEIEAHLDRAGIFLQRLTDTEGGPAHATLDLDVKAAFSISGDLLVAHANLAAREALGIRKGNRLQSLPLQPDDVAALGASIRAQLAFPGREPRLLRFSSVRSGRSILFHVATQAPARDAPPGVVVRTTELGWPEELSRVMRDAFSLTSAEVEIVRALAEGRSPREIAAERKRSFATVRTQISAVLAKTETHSQAELIRLTLGLMDVVGTVGAAEEDRPRPAEKLGAIPFRTLRTRDGRRYDFIEFGDPAGRACLFLPLDYGLIRWPRRAEIAARARGIRVVVPVRAGFGHSSPLPANVRHYGQATAEDLLYLLDHLGIRRTAVIALGADLRFAVALAVLAPGRIAGILGCSAALPVVTAQQYERMGKWHRFILANARYAPQILPFLVRSGFALARRIGKERFFRAVNSGSPADMRTFSDPEIREAILVGAEICLGAEHSAHDAFARECIDSETDWADLIHACPCPVRLLQGGEDPQTPADTVRELSSRFPKLDIEIIEDAGQLLFFQEWPLVLRELEPLLPA